MRTLTFVEVKEDGSFGRHYVSTLLPYHNNGIYESYFFENFGYRTPVVHELFRNSKGYVFRYEEITTEIQRLNSGSHCPCDTFRSSQFYMSELRYVERTFRDFLEIWDSVIVVYSHGSEMHNIVYGLNK